MLFKKKRKQKVFILSLDGVPYSYLKDKIESGKLAAFKRVFSRGTLKRHRSVIPTISSVAWSSFMTGKNPGKHGIFGFIDRTPDPFDLFIPTSRTMATKTLWEVLSDAGKRVAVMNVPVTTPPRAVNGVLISGFLSTNIDKATHPKELASTLKEMGYIIDVDPWTAKENREDFLKQLHVALDRRIEVMEHLMKKENWDFFMCHVMETDRINHFLLPGSRETRFTAEFSAFYERLGEIVERVQNGLPEDTLFLSLSDHGMCPIEHEVFLNRWLHEKGYLHFKKEPAKDFGDLDPSTRAYSLIPGRIYVNLKGREEFGSVDPASYESLRQELKEALTDLKDPENGNPIVQRVYMREELYSGPLLEKAADLIVMPHDGYDLKGALYREELLGRSHLEGMHTYDDAFLYARGRTLRDEDTWIGDVMPGVLDALSVERDPELDGVSIFADE
jgi:predicted AlkP superfamily phosphohydrolase/phosphomutase